MRSSTPSAQNNNHTDGNTIDRTVSNANNNDVVSNNTTLNTKTNENGSGGQYLNFKEIQEEVRHSSDKPEEVAIAQPALNRPKKE